MARKYLVTEDEFLSATVNEAGELVWTRDNGDQVVAGAVVGPAVTDAQITDIAENTATAFSGLLAARAAAPLAKTTPGPAAPLTFVNAADFGANPGNTGDQTSALNAAAAAAGIGGKVRVPNGAVYRCTGTLNIPAWCTFEAPTSAFGAGGTAPAEIRFAISGSATGIVMGAYATLRHILVRGPGSNVGTCIGVAGGSMILDYASVLAFSVGVHLTDAFYAYSNRLRLQRNGTGMRLTNCYNVGMIAPSIYGWGADNTPGTGIDGAARPLTIVEGSIETVRHGIIMDTAQMLNLHDVYFENMVPDGQAWPTTGVFHGVYARDEAKVTINADGCMVYLNGMTSFITTINSTDVVLIAKGQHFVGGTGLANTPNGYEVSHGQQVDIGPDNWAEVTKVGAVHVSVAGGLPVRGGVVVSGGKVYDGRARVPSVQTIAHNANGTITLDASQYEGAIVNLAANVTGVTVTNATRNQEITLTFAQDATGGRTYAFPAGSRFAGGVTPADTTPSTRTTVRLRWDSGRARWDELSRAVAVPA